MSTPDVIDSLVGVADGDVIDAIRQQRPAARENADASYLALFAPADPIGVSLLERFALGYWVASLSQAGPAAALYRGQLLGLDAAVARSLDDALLGAITTGPYGSFPPGPLSAEDEDGLRWSSPPWLRQAVGDRLAAALEHAHLLTFRPRDASPDALQRLIDAGWTTTAIVTLSQLVSFVHFQLRVATGLTVLKETL